MDHFAREDLRESAQKPPKQFGQDFSQQNLERIPGRNSNLWQDKVKDWVGEHFVSRPADTLAKFLALAFVSLECMRDEFISSLLVLADILKGLRKVLSEDTGIANSSVATLSKQRLQRRNKVKSCR